MIEKIQAASPVSNTKKYLPITSFGLSEGINENNLDIWFFSSIWKVYTEVIAIINIANEIPEIKDRLIAVKIIGIIKVFSKVFW